MLMRLLSFTAFTLLLFLGSSIRAQLPEETAIDRYVQKPDAAYRWEIVRSESAGNAKVVVVDMVSQRWLSEKEVDRPEWQHWLTLVVPKEIKSNVGLLMIGGGKNGGAPPEKASTEVMQIALATGTVVAELKMVPNQPLVFHGDGVPRSEDDLIAYTWDQFLKTGESDWLARNAMIKSAVRAMDTMTAATGEVADGHVVDQFVVAGASKRGWTTWLTGAMDKRVVGIIPIVIDVLNTNESMRHHFAAYGYWAPAIGNYVQHHIMERLDHPRLMEAYQLIDPYYYRHRLTMPKLVLNAAGDQFFLPDSSQFYWDALQGEKNLRYVPNTDHGMGGSDAVETLVAFYSMIVRGQPRPEFSWERGENGTVVVRPSTPPQEVRLWQATNPDARDFRVETLGKKYTSQVLTAGADGSYTATVADSEKGWTAFFVELTFDSGGLFPLKLTTNVWVTPDTLPYSDKSPALTPSITLRCELYSEEDAQSLIKEARELFSDKLSITDVISEVEGTVCYFNWVPKEFGGEIDLLRDWIKTKNCKKVNMQLEAGRAITRTN